MDFTLSSKKYHLFSIDTSFQNFLGTSALLIHQRAGDRMRRIIFLLCLLSVTAPLPCLAAEPSPPTTFTFSQFRTVVSQDFIQVKMINRGVLGSTKSPWGLDWFSQAGTQLGPDGALSTWLVLEAGPHHQLDLKKGVMHQTIRPGVYWSLSSASAKPLVEYVNNGTAWDGHIGWLTINSLSLDTATMTPGFYYEGFVQAMILPKALGLGGFWENTGGFQAGPRLQAKDAFLQVGVVGPPMVYVGLAHVW